jgi:hypothetical protein
MIKFLKLTAPITMPFAFLALMRGVWFAAGAEWSQPEFAACIALVFGLVFGLSVGALICLEEL